MNRGVTKIDSPLRNIIYHRCACPLSLSRIAGMSWSQNFIIQYYFTLPYYFIYNFTFLFSLPAAIRPLRSLTTILTICKSIPPSHAYSLCIIHSVTFAFANFGPSLGYCTCSKLFIHSISRLTSSNREPQFRSDLSIQHISLCLLHCTAYRPCILP